jgi:hypothetical protein
MVQILGGLITYLLLAIYCREQFNEKVSIKRVRQLRTTILNELFTGCSDAPPDSNRDNIVKDQKIMTQAKTEPDTTDQHCKKHSFFSRIG